MLQYAQKNDKKVNPTATYSTVLHDISRLATTDYMKSRAILRCKGSRTENSVINARPDSTRQIPTLHISWKSEANR